MINKNRESPDARGNEVQRGVSLRDCECEGFFRYNTYLHNQQTFAAMRGMVYPEAGIFIYCPWCGKKREAVEL